MELAFEIEKYDRIGGSYATVLIRGETLRSCLLQAFDTLSLYDNAEDVIYDEIVNIGYRLSDQDLINRMIEQSGDGSDFIFSIKNNTDGTMLYYSGEQPEDDSIIISEYDDEPPFEKEVEKYSADLA